MRKVNALQLRQSLSKILAILKKTGEPVLLEKGRKPAAVIISLEDFHTRFSEKDADERRKAIQQEILKMTKPAKDPTSSEEILRRLRSA